MKGKMQFLILNYYGKFVYIIILQQLKVDSNKTKR